MLSKLDPRDLHAITWSRRAKVAWPFPVELALSKCMELIEQPAGTRARAIFGDAPTYAGTTRLRRKRSDGLTNAVSLLCALIASCDLSTGLVALPIDGSWERKSWYDLDGLAYGEQVEGARSMRRTERAAQQLIALGLVKSVPWKVQTGAGEYRDTPGLKWVTDRAWRLLGVWSAIRRERRRRAGQKAKAKAEALIASITRTNSHARKRLEEPSGAVAIGAVLGRNVASPASPASRDGPRPASEAAKAALETIRQLLGS